MNTNVLYATTDDGAILPVIDVTNPAFAVAVTGTELAALADRHARESTRDIPPQILEALRKSSIGRALMAASGTFLSGMDTYRLKLGPDQLSVGASPIDRHIAASFPALTARLRLQDLARLLAGGLAVTAAAEPSRPLLLLNIGGGPAADSWNALLCLHAEHLGMLPRRQTVIAVMDLDDHGPSFGARAIESLRASAAPLGGLNIGFQYLSYDWSEAHRLRETLECLRVAGTACAVSSEGALFEYGSDSEIVSNLQAIHAASAPDTFVVGSVTRDGILARNSPLATRPRSIPAFRALVEQAGWVVQHVIDRPFSHHLRLVKA